MCLLSLHNISKIYAMSKNEVPALQNVSFGVKTGEFVSIVGKSGSGKSTLLNIIGGLDTPSSGSISFEERNLAAMSGKELAEHRKFSIGMIFQSFNLIHSRTALENITLALAFGGMPRKQRKKRAEKLLTEVGLQHRTEHKPSELSGGENQRVAVARALANSPKLLLADEPTGNLDSVTSNQIIELLYNLNRDQNQTVIMVTHDTDMAEKISHKIIKLIDGKIAVK